MNILAVLNLVLVLLGGVAAAFNKSGLTAAAQAINAAIAQIEAVHGTDVTKGQLEAMRLDPKW